MPESMWQSFNAQSQRTSSQNLHAGLPFAVGNHSTVSPGPEVHSVIILEIAIMLARAVFT